MLTPNQLTPNAQKSHPNILPFIPVRHGHLLWPCHLYRIAVLERNVHNVHCLSAVGSAVLFGG